MASDQLAAEPGTPERRQAFLDIDETLDWLHGQRVDVTEARRAHMGPVTRPAQTGSPLEAAKVTLGMVEFLWLARQSDARYDRELRQMAAPLRAVGTALARAVKDAEEASTPDARKAALVHVATAIKAVYPVLLRFEAPMWPMFREALRIVEGRSGEPRTPGR